MSTWAARTVFYRLNQRVAYWYASPMHLWVYPLLILSSFINIIVPISGSATVTPLLSTLYGVKTAVGVTSFLFVITGCVRIFIFRKHIQKDDIKRMLPPSLFGASLGVLLFINLSGLFVTVLLIILLVIFLYKKVRHIRSKDAVPPSNKVTAPIIGFISGILQGGGVTGGVDLRNGFLFSKDLSLAEVNGTTAVVGTSNFALATIVRLATNQLNGVDIVKIIWILPFMLLGMFLGRKISFHISTKMQNILTVLVIIFAICLLVSSLL